MKAAGAEVVPDISQQAREVAAPIILKVQELLDTAKRQLGEGRLQEALSKLRALSGEKLPAEPRTLADSLQDRIDKLPGTTSRTATDAAAAGNRLKQ